MSRRALVVLMALATLLLATAAWLHLADDRLPGAGDPLLPGLRGELAEISTLRVSAAGPEIIATLELRGERWVVAERDDWPADTGQLRALLLALADARRVEARTANPSQWHRLGVAPMDSAEASGMEVALETPAGPLALVIGRRDGAYTHVRLAHEPAAWLVSGRMEPGRTTGDWLDPTMPDLAAPGVVALTLSHPDGEQVRLQRPENASSGLELQAVPAGRSLLHATVTDATLAALSALRVEDVAPRDEIFTEDKAPVHIEIETADGLTWRWLALLADDVPWMTLAPTEADTAAEGSPLGSELAHLAGRALRIPRHRYDQLTRRLEDYLAPVGTD